MKKKELTKLHSLLALGTFMMTCFEACFGGRIYG